MYVGFGGDVEFQRGLPRIAQDYGKLEESRLGADFTLSEA